MQLFFKAILYFAIGYALGGLAALIANAETAERVVLTTTNTVVFRGVVDSGSVVAAQVKLSVLQFKRGSKKYPIYLVIDSPGGSIDAGLNFIEFAKTIPNLKTITIFGASMASAIAEALPGERLITANGIMMFHRVQGRFSGYFETGEVESRLMISKAMVRSMELTNAARMRTSMDDYKRMVAIELWLYGSSNIDFHTADRVVDLVCTPELIKAETVNTPANLLEALLGGGGTFSGCPLLRSPKGAASGKNARYLVPSVENYSTITKLLSNAK